MTKKADKKTVLIIGGGFAGLTLAKQLPPKYFDIILIDKNNYHQFLPLIYQVATCGLESSAISFPFRRNFQSQKNFRFRIAEAKQILPEENAIDTTVGKIEYDYLVIAAGTQTNFFGMKNIETQAFAMKTVPEALALRNTILCNIEKALNLPNPEDRKKYLNIVIAGAGATGVEIAGALAEMKRYIFPKDYPELDLDELQIYLVEASNKTLAVMSEKSSHVSQKYLEKMGVNILLNTSVTDYTDDTVFFNDGTSLPSKTFIWTTGVKAVSLEGLPKETVQARGRIAVNEFNQVQGFKNIFAIGDICVQANQDKRFPNGHPQVAQVAIQQAKYLAKNLTKIEHSKEAKPFSYINKGSLATIGRNKAVADFPFMHMTGFWAWFVWAVIHLLSIVGVKNKLQVMLDWTQKYWSYDDSLRLIMKAKYPNR